MTTKQKIDSKEYGLELGLINLNYFFNTNHLHYGLFDDLAPIPANLAVAQEKYMKLLVSKIPAEVNSILDVGCGSGALLKELLAKGHQVDGVVPSSLLANNCRQLTENSDCKIYQQKFEDFNPDSDKRYDMIIFSESFQYIPYSICIEKSLKLLNDKGLILVSDFFKNDPMGECKIGGGHVFTEWEQYYKGQAIKLLSSEDITKRVSPTFDLSNDFCKNCLEPNSQLIAGLLSTRFPTVTKLIAWKFRKKITKLKNKHFSGTRTGEHFLAYKKYMIYLFQKQ